MRILSLLVPLFAVLVPQLASADQSGDRPVLAVAPIQAPGFPAPVTQAVMARLVEMARDSREFTVMDQGDLDTVLRFQKQGVSPVMSDPVALGKLVAAREVLTVDVQKLDAARCSLNLKITNVETGIVDAARLESGGCAATDLFVTAQKAWSRLLVGRITITTDPAGLPVSVDEGAPAKSPVSLELPAGPHHFAVVAQGYAATATTVAVRANQNVALQLRAPKLDYGVLLLIGSPIGASVYHEGVRIGSLPFEQKVVTGQYRFSVETDLGRYPVNAQVVPNKRVRVRVDAPFAALRNFDDAFKEANEVARSGDHNLAVELYDKALAAAREAMGLVPDDAKGELAAAISYTQGAMALELAWLAKEESELLGSIDAYCAHLSEADARFAEARMAVPKVETLKVSANGLAKRRGPLALGPCHPSARFATNIDRLVWSLGSSPAVDEDRARSKAVLLELRKQDGLTAPQKEWLKGELALLFAMEKMAEIEALRPQLLSNPRAVLPSICKLAKTARGYAASARQYFPRQTSEKLPAEDRHLLLDRIEYKAQQDEAMCRS